MTSQPLDKPKLLSHIKAKAEHPKLVVYAVLTGLAVAIERGDFDEPTEQRTGHTEHDH